MELLNIIILIIYGFVLGFLSAIPIGAVQLDVAKKAINGHLKPAIATALGSATSDFIYGVLTLFSVGFFIFDKTLQLVIYILGIFVLSYLLYKSFKEFAHHKAIEQTNKKYRKRYSYISGFLIAITNPGIIIWWIVGYRLLLDLDLFQTITIPIKMTFILSACTGLGGYLIFLAYLIHHIKKSLSNRLLKIMNLVLIVLLVVVIIYFFIKIISALL